MLNYQRVLLVQLSVANYYWCYWGLGYPRIMQVVAMSLGDEFGPTVSTGKETDPDLWQDMARLCDIHVYDVYIYMIYI